MMPNNSFIEREHLTLRYQGSMDEGVSVFLRVFNRLEGSGSKPTYTNYSQNTVGHVIDSTYYFEERKHEHSRAGPCPSPETLDKLLSETLFVGKAMIRKADLEVEGRLTAVWERDYPFVQGKFTKETGGVF